MAQLTGKLVAVVATNGFEDSELTSPVEALKNAGAEVRIIAPEAGTIKGKNGTEISVDATTADEVDNEFDGLVIPGGLANPDNLRMDENAVEIVRKHVEAGLPTGSICHGPWLLAEADVLEDREVTSYPSIRTDLENAGAIWVDEEVVCDEGLVTSRTPDDLPAFNQKLIEEIAEGEH